MKSNAWTEDNYLVKSEVDGNYYFGVRDLDGKMVWSKYSHDALGSNDGSGTFPMNGLEADTSPVHAVTFEGVGFSADILPGGADGVDHLYLNLGYSHKVNIPIPAVIDAETGRVHGSPALFMKSGFESGTTEQFRAKLIALKPASAYKKRGIGTPLSWEVPRKVVKK